MTAGDCAVFEDTLSALRTAAQADFYTVGVADPSAVGDEEAIVTCCNRYIHSFSELAEAPCPLGGTMDKPPLHTHYYALDVAEDWQSFSYICKENVMDQMDRYNFAAANWAYTLEDLEEKPSASCSLLPAAMKRP